MNFEQRLNKVIQLHDELKKAYSEYQDRRQTLREQLREAHGQIEPDLKRMPGYKLNLNDGKGSLKLVVSKHRQPITKGLIIKGAKRFFRQWPGKSEEQIEQITKVLLRMILDSREVKEEVEIIRTYPNNKKRKKIDEQILGAWR
jgi:hypothetical protein